MVTQPQNLDTACTLGLLQEEALDEGIHKEFKCSEASLFARTATIKGALPLPLPPRRPQAVPDPVAASEFRTSLLPLTTSCPHCEITVELVDSVFVAATSGLQAIGVLWFHKFMLYKKARIYVLRCSRKLTILLSKILNRPLMLRHS